jgi:RNA polymerase sigma-70 factor (ECF subfamily)
MLEDKWLLWKFKHGSGQALERIYDKYEGWLMTVATALLNNTHAAEDVLQDVFVGLVQSAACIKLDGSLRAYLAVCVANRARTQLKRSRLQPVPLGESDTFESDAPGPDLQAVQTEQAILVNRALSQLPYEQRETIILHLHGELKFSQLARLQNTSADTIRSRYRYGLEKLRSLLSSEVMP